MGHSLLIFHLIYKLPKSVMDTYMKLNVVPFIVIGHTKWQDNVQQDCSIKTGRLMNT
jgi:hypothetical protein